MEEHVQSPSLSSPERHTTEDGECSEWFEVGQGLRQGFVLSPLLFNVFFAAVLHIALERFSRNADILGDLVYLDESPKGMGPETARRRRDARRLG